MFRIIIPSAFLLLFSTIHLLAQVPGKFGPIKDADGHTKGHAVCGHDALVHKIKELNPNYEQIRQADEAEIRKHYNKTTNANSVQNGKRIIPVVVHVIHQGGTENISNAQIIDALRVANEDYSRTNADAIQTRSVFSAIAADMNIEFRLAKIDPDGNCTDGIVRVYSPLTNHNMDSDETALKSLSIWPTNKYHNIWVVKNIESGGQWGTILGYANLPGSHTQWSTTYGAVMTHYSMGTIGTATSDGRTLSHELGHNLGLLHPFQGGCGTSDCANSGDYVCDTPPAKDPTFGCNTNQNSCSTDNPNQPDQIENYMSYDYCQNMFSAGQKLRVDAFFATFSHYQDLMAASNLIATGTNDGYTTTPCKATASFYTVWDASCLNGDNFAFINNSYNADLTAPGVSYSWEFENGTPATSTDENPTGINFTTPGYHNVTLMVTNAQGTDTTVMEDFVYIKKTYDAPQYESFEDAAFPDNNTDAEKYWEVTTEMNNATWTRVDNAASDGSAALRIRNIAVNLNDNRALITPAYNLTTLGSAILTFDYAYAARNSSSDCELRLYTSNNCGRTWSLRGVLNNSALVTAPPQVAGFLPTATDWKTQTVNLGSLVFSNDVKIKFEWLNKSLSNFGYIDNVKIFDPTTGITAGTDPSRFSISVFPNPVNSNTTIGLQLPVRGKYNLSIYNANGQLQTTTEIENNGKDNRIIPIEDFWNNRTPGLYLIRLEGDNLSQTKKILVNY